MRRKDREVTELKKIIDILRRCDTIRLGLQGEEGPYVVPLSFGFEETEELPLLYFHGALVGRKLELLQADPRVCVEGDIFIKTEPVGASITARYESVIGFGVCELLTDAEECRHGMQLIVDHYGYTDYKVETNPALKHTAICRIKLSSLTGKCNLPKE